MSGSQTYYIPEKHRLPLNADQLSLWYSNLLSEVSGAGYSDDDIAILKDRRNYYGKYFSEDSRDFFLHHFAGNLTKTIDYLFGPRKNNIRFLEIGCGCGNQLLLMALLGAETVGCDVKKDVCNLVQKRKTFYDDISRRRLDISLIREDVFNVDWDKLGKFDAVNFLFSFNDLEPNEKMLELIAKLLRPGGRVVFQETNQSNYYNRLFRWRGSMKPQEVIKRLEQLGFRVDLLRGGYAIPPIFWRFMPRNILSRIDRFLCRSLLLSVSYQLMAEKVCIPQKKDNEKIFKKNTRILYIKEKTLYAQTGSCICSSEDLGKTWKILSNKPPYGAVSSSKLYTRLTRRGIHSALLLQDGYMIFTAKNAIYKFDSNNGTISHSVAVPRGSRPLTVCQTRDGVILWGEYFRNPNRDEVNIYASRDNGDSWQVIYTFRQRVRHVHGVFYDPSDDKVWVTTGDDDEESAIWVTGNMFKTLDRVIGGDQSSRAFHLIFMDDYVYFGTDTPYKVNRICRMDKRTYRVERLAAVDGSVYWGCKVNDYIFFSTAVEPSKVNTNKYASIWGSLNGVNWKCIRKYKKDIWPLIYGQAGQIYLPQGINTTGYLFYTPVATECNHTLHGLAVDNLF